MKSVKQETNEHFVSVLIIIGGACAYVLRTNVCTLHAYMSASLLVYARARTISISWVWAGERKPNNETKREQKPIFFLSYIRTYMYISVACM